METVVRYMQAMIMLLALLLALAVAAIVLLPRVMGWQTMVVLSGSMEPAMPVDGLAFVEPVDPDEIEPGDVVTFPRPDKRDANGESTAVVSHRVVAVSDQLGEPTLWTKGDANETFDSWAVPASEVIGEVRFTVPYLGSISRHMQTPRGYLSVLAIPALLVIIVESINIARAVRAGRSSRSSGHATT
jgi:signal peptidase